MARPLKEGLDYFSLDTDFLQNRKVRRIKMACGAQSISVLICLLCNIYRNKGYYILWDEDLPFLIADEIGVSEGAVTEIMKKAIQVGFFHQQVYEKESVLTSEEIQKRYSRVCNDSKRKDWKILPDYSVINGFPPEETGLSGGETPKTPEESTHSKGKETKEEKSKEELVAAKAAALKKAKNEFIDELKTFSKKYGGPYPSEMVANFFRYWTELNPSGTKMKFQLEKTWETDKRLTTWANREKTIQNGNSKNGSGTSVDRITALKALN